VPPVKSRRAVKSRVLTFFRYLYTLRVDEPEKAEKLRKSLPPTVKVVDVK
jgi:hypothetical protein